MSIHLEPDAELQRIDQLSHRILCWLHTISEFYELTENEPKWNHKTQMKHLNSVLRLEANNKTLLLNQTYYF